ncbi:taste receptor type 2 member 40-like [Mantella aurantiaca]
MPSARIIVLVVVHCVFIVTCFISNTFILTVHFLDWLKTRKLNSCDLIINCIVTINIILQASVTLHEILFLMFLEFYIETSLASSVIAIMSSLTFSSLWCATSLCFYYCVKIVNFNGALFYKIKANIIVMVPWLLVLSCVISWTIGLTAFGDIYIRSSPNFVNEIWNTSSIALSFASRCNCLFHVYTFVSAFAFFIISITAGAIIVSLCNHMKQIAKNSEGFGNTRLTSLKSAAQTVTSLLILYLVLFGSLNIIFNGTNNGSSLIVDIFFAVAASCPTINAIVLINGNRKLSNTLKHLLGIDSGAVNNEVTVTTT